MSDRAPIGGGEHANRPRAMRIARAYSAFVSRNRWWVLLGVLAITAVSAIPIPDLLANITTNRSVLQDPDEPARKRFDEVVRKFGTTYLATVVLEGHDREALHRTVERIRATLTQDPPANETATDPCTDTRFSRRQVRDVLAKVDLSEFERRGIYYLGAEDLRRLGDSLESADGPAGSAAPPLSGLQAALDGIGDSLESGQAQGTDDAQNAEMLTRLVEALDRVDRWIAEPYPDERLADSAAPELAPEDRHGVDDAGYLAEGTDPIRMVMFVRPESDSEDEDVFRCFTHLVRAAVAEGLRDPSAGDPGGAAAAGAIRSWVTGMPAVVTDDMDVIRLDASRVTLISGGLIILLLLLYYRSLRSAVALFIPLAIGVCWTMGLTGIVVGRLTVITLYFGGVLFGLGIDYAIQFMGRYGDERRAGKTPEEAFAMTFAHTGGGVLTGAATTMFAFGAVGLSEFQGFSELGIIAAMGVVCIFVATLVIFPLLVFIVHRPGPKSVTLDMGMERVLRTRGARVAVVVVAFLVAACGFGAVPFRAFDYDPMKLMPRDVESVQGAERLLQTDYSQETAIATAPSAAAAADLGRRYELLARATTESGEPTPRTCPGRPPTIARVESLDRYERFLPAMSEEKIDAVRRIARHDPFLSGLQEQAEEGLRTPVPVDPEKAVEALERIADEAGNLAFDFRGSRPDSPLTAALTALADRANALAGTLGELPADRARERLEGFQRWFLGELASGLRIVRDGLALNPTEVRALPESVRERFRSRDGSAYAVYVAPTGRVGDKGFLPCFVGDLQSVDPGATGFPVTHYDNAATIERSFEQATVYAFIAVLLCLGFHLRSLWQVATAMAPLFIGIGLVIGVQVAVGIPFNFVNVMALPVLLGTGVDYGVYLVHRHREHPGSSEGLASTATAITLSALTTTMGFGALMSSGHHGMWSLGFSLTLGILGCLAAAQLVVPVILSLARGGK